MLRSERQGSMEQKTRGTTGAGAGTRFLGAILANGSWAEMAESNQKMQTRSSRCRPHCGRFAATSGSGYLKLLVSVFDYSGLDSIRKQV